MSVLYGGYEAHRFQSKSNKLAARLAFHLSFFAFVSSVVDQSIPWYLPDQFLTHTRIRSGEADLCVAAYVSALYDHFRTDVGVADHHPSLSLVSTSFAIANDF
jgi:hypothetical protein